MAAKIAPTCIKCFDPDKTVTMALDMNGDGDVQFTCGGCDEVFTCEDVNNFLAAAATGWGKVVSWVEAMPDA